MTSAQALQVVDQTKELLAQLDSVSGVEEAYFDTRIKPLNETILDSNDKVVAKAGMYIVPTEEYGNVYMEEVPVRLLAKRFYYSHMQEQPDKSWKLVSESMYEKTMRGEYLDTVGTTKCGRIPVAKGEYETLSKEIKDHNGERKFNLIAWGLVSGKGITDDGTKVELSNVPVTIVRTGTRAGEFFEFIKKAYGNDRYYLFTTLLTKTKKDTVGTNTFYIWNYDKGTPLPLTQDIVDSISGVNEIITQHNTRVYEAYNKASEDSNVAEALDIDVDGAGAEDLE